MAPPTLTLIPGGAGQDADDRITPDGVWSLSEGPRLPWLVEDDDTGGDRVLIVATHRATGLEVTHDVAGVDEWLISGIALAELTAQAADTITGIAADEDRDAAWAALLRLGELLPGTAVELVEYRCECGGYLALAPGRRLVHVDVCRHDIDPTTASPRDDDADDDEVVVVCDPAAHRFCLAPAPRPCLHACKARGRVYVPHCDADHDIGSCCGEHHGYGDE